MARRLSPEIVSLIHHVELNESGWWKKAIGQVIKGVLWKANAPRNISEIHAALRQEFGESIADEKLARQLDSLANQGTLTQLPGQTFKLTEQAREELTVAYQKATAEQDQCHREFLASCGVNCPTLEPEQVWREFSKALTSAVHVAGANLFHLLADGNLARDVDWLSNFLSRFEVRHQEGLRKVLSEFFSSGNHACRNQVLRLLSAHFFAEASQLSPETISVIESERKKRTIKVILDTNFIFSVLQLHDNPGDEAAVSLLDISRRSGRHLDVKLYVLPSTLDEAQRVLINQMRMVERIRTTAAMSRAALTQPLPSIARKFFDAAAKAPGMSAATFFQPYIDDLRTILRDKGIAVLEAHPSIYNQRQDVVDDVLDETRREEQEVPEARRKGYDTLLHDVVLWHAVKDRRPLDTDSPFEVEYWAVSIDWRLIAFDRKKRHANASKLPVVLHPSNLIQLVQFWVPRSQELEETLVDSLRLPLFFQSFDPEDERATVKVLEAISRFENVGDIPENTLKVVLANQALRGRLREADSSNDEIFELVREEFLSHHKDVVQVLEQTQGSLSFTVATLETERRTREQSEKSLQEANSQLEAATHLAATTQARADEAQRRAEEAERRAADAERRASEVEKIREENRLRTAYVVGIVVFPSILGVLLGYWLHSLLGRLDSKQLTDSVRLFSSIALGLLPLTLGFLASPWLTSKREALQTWWLSRIISFIGKKAIAAPGGLALTAIYQGGVWEWVKSATGWSP